MNKITSEINEHITLIDRTRTPIDRGILSVACIEEMEKVLSAWGKVLMYLNRRWAYRSLICEDCSYDWKCPNCDVGLTLHTSPKEQLVCHHCNTVLPVPSICPQCHGSNLKWVGLALQGVETYVRSKFNTVEVERIDSDTVATSRIGAQIVVSTEYILRENLSDFALVVVLLPETELNIPRFDIEERVYSHLRSLAAEAKELIIETAAPRLPLIQNIVNGNYRDFLVRTLQERKQFGYPPYSGLAYIRVTGKNINQIEDICAKLVNKLQMSEWAIQNNEIVRYDRSIRIKRAGEYTDTILVRSKNIEKLLDPVRNEILRNRGVRLELCGEKILT